MGLLAKHSEKKEDRSNIITLGILAKEAKKKNPNVVDATIGMLYDEQGKLITFKSVDKALFDLTSEEKYAYSSTPGNVAYHEALKHWIFQDRYEEILKTMKCSVIATPGGSGAISNTFSNYLNPNDQVLLPEYMWANYKQFAYENFASFTTYSMFEDGHFNLNDLKKKMIKLKESQNRVVLVINDPCHNPTGYTMSYEEWKTLIQIINQATEDGMPFVLLYDMAYIDYDSRGFAATRKNMALFPLLNSSVLVILAFSGSKTFALYGLRIGAQIALSKSEQVIHEFFSANKFSSRAKWSTTTNLGMNLITKVLTNPTYLKEFKEELQEASLLLTRRANAFIKSAQEAKLNVLPFSCGFFITIPCLHAEQVYQELVKKDIHIIPLAGVLRVTIAAISEEDCRRLPKEIVDVMNIFE